MPQTLHPNPKTLILVVAITDSGPTLTLLCGVLSHIAFCGARAMSSKERGRSAASTKARLTRAKTKAYWWPYWNQIQALEEAAMIHWGGGEGGERESGVSTLRNAANTSDFSKIQHSFLQIFKFRRPLLSHNRFFCKRCSMRR